MHRYTQTASEKREKSFSGREIKITPSETTKEAEAPFVFCSSGY
jgi:hypothetical protein